MHHFKVIVRDELYEDMYRGIGLTNYKMVTCSTLQLQNMNREALNAPIQGKVILHKRLCTHMKLGKF